MSFLKLGRQYTKCPRSVIHTLKLQRGFTLVEMVVYIAIIALLFVVVVNTVISVSNAWGDARVKRDVLEQGGGAFERMLREVRLADSVDVPGSTFGAHPGALQLSTIASASDDTPMTRQFLISGEDLVMREDSMDSLLTDGIEITNLVFYHIDNGDTSEAVRILMTVESGEGRFVQSENFYGTAVLRRSY